MTTDERHRPSHRLRRRIRVRRRKTGEPYAVAARAVEAEQALGLRHLSDPAVPADLAAAVRAAGSDDLVVADGTSCRHQIADLGGRRAVHSVQVLDRALAARR